MPSDTETNPINLNDASMEELQSIPGIEAISAQKIINMRELGIEVNLTGLGQVPYFPVMRIRAAIESGIVAPLPLEELAYSDPPISHRPSARFSDLSPPRPAGGADFYNFVKQKEEKEDEMRHEMEHFRRKDMEQHFQREAEQMFQELQKENEMLKRSMRDGTPVLKSSPAPEPESDTTTEDEKVGHDRQADTTEAERVELQKISVLAKDLPADGISRGKAYYDKHQYQTSTPASKAQSPNVVNPGTSNQKSEYANTSSDEQQEYGARGGDYTPSGKSSRKASVKTTSSSRTKPPKVSSKSAHTVSKRLSRQKSSSSSDGSSSTDIPSRTYSSNSSSSDEPDHYRRRYRKKKSKGSHRRRRSPSPPKLPQFNGSMSAWRPFIFQFKEVARVGKWSKRTRLERLMGCLTNKAVTFVEKLRKEYRRGYKELLSSLEKRFGTSDPASTIRLQIQGACQEDKEPLEEWADRIYALSIDGYPGAPEDMVDSLAVEHFYSGMRDKKAALAVSQGKRKAYSIAKALKYTKEYLHQQTLLLGKSYSSRKISFSESKRRSPLNGNGLGSQA